MSVVQVAPSQIVSSVSSSAPKQFIDAGRVKIGGACRLATAAVPAQFADKGKVKIGGGCRLPNR